MYGPQEVRTVSNKKELELELGRGPRCLAPPAHMIAMKLGCV